MGNIDKYITYEPVSSEDNFNVCLEKIAGKIVLLDTPELKPFNKLINAGKVESIELFPYGLGERDENGNVKNFNLIGFSVKKINLIKEKTNGTND